MTKEEMKPVLKGLRTAFLLLFWQTMPAATNTLLRERGGVSLMTHLGASS